MSFYSLKKALDMERRGVRDPDRQLLIIPIGSPDFLETADIAMLRGRGRAYGRKLQ